MSEPDARQDGPASDPSSALEDAPALEEAVADDTTVTALQLDPDEAGAPDPLTPQFEEPSFEEPSFEDAPPA